MRVNIPEDIRRFQRTLQYARSKVDYAIGEFVYMLPSDMNLRIGNFRNYNNKILISSPSFKIGTNVKIHLLSSENRRLNDDGEQAKLKDKPDVKSKEVDNWRLMVKTEPDAKPKVITKPNIKPNEKHKQDVHWALSFEHSLKGAQYKPNVKFDRESNQDVKGPDTNKITIEPSFDRRSMELNNYEEEKVALILGTTAVFTVLLMFK